MEPPPPATWQDGVLRSNLYGDIYFSQEGGLAESRAVFLQGCGLPEAWAGRSRFVVGELGFGTGLNIAALLDLWSRARPEAGFLHIFSVEADPLSRDDAARALASFPEIGWATKALIQRWPGTRRGFHRIDLPEARVSLDLAVMDVEEALKQWQGRADAWFLDGFSPASNPDMWRDEVLALVAQRSAPGARAATFTVAGAVRRSFAAQGFSVERKPGYGRKRERLEAQFPGQPDAASPPKRIVIVGGGIGGASLCRALNALGRKVEVLAGPVGASGNPAALVMPSFDASGGVRSKFYAAAFYRAAQLYAEDAGFVLATSALAIEEDFRRLETVSAQTFFEPGALRPCRGDESATWLGETEAPQGLMIRDALVIDPKAVIEAWLGDQALQGAVMAIEPAECGWRLQLGDGEVLEADTVIIAAGWGAAALAPDLPLTPIRGQASWAAVQWPVKAASFGGYAIPTREGVLFGATHDRGDTATDLRDEDHERNRTAIAGVRPALAGRIDAGKLAGRAAIRAATPNQIPVAGELAPGLYALAGLGSRGFTTAPILAEHLAARILGAPSPLTAEITALVERTRL